MRSAVLALVLVLSVTRSAGADCARDADVLRAHLEDQARRAGQWNLAWQIVFGASAALQVTLTLTETNLLGDWDAEARDRAYVNTGKAVLAAGFALAAPLRVEVPPAATDRCVELANLRSSVARAGKNERTAFWLGHLGGLAVNLSGAAILWYRRSLTVAGISLAESVPIGLLNVYTMPRGAWHTWRSQGERWSISVVPHPEGWAVSAGRAF